MDDTVKALKDRHLHHMCLMPDCTAKTYSEELCSLHWAQKYSHVPDLTGPYVYCKLCGKEIHNAEEAKEKCRAKLGELD